MRRRPVPASADVIGPAFISRLERFDSVDSTQAVVRGWIEGGTDEVCAAISDTQTHGRGRHGRDWQARSGSALLGSLGFRPTELSARHGWRLPAIVSMALLETATALLGPTADRLVLKWPNDIVAVHHDELLKLAGVITEGATDGDRLTTAIVGVGINVNWPKTEFPPELAASMWSLSEATGGRRVDRDALLSGWLERLEPMYAALMAAEFDVDRWMAAQVTTGMEVEVQRDAEPLRGIAVGLDDDSGALLVRIEPGGTIERIGHGEVTSCRLIGVREEQ
jgi:BirA family biotin operon repressor/biotin-[acetyl-CoA-carboxylase] ligase